MKTTLNFLMRTALLMLPVSVALAQQPTAQERVVALKASLAASQVILKQYEWVETTVISLKGEEKSRQLNRCYHGADGKVQKIPLTTPAPPPKKRGLRGRIAAAKTEELTDYMKSVVALVKDYVPPQPVLIQKAKDASKVTVQPLPGQKARLNFTDYLKPGDSLALELDLASNRPLSMKVSTYLDSKAEAVTLEVRFKTLDNNATYGANIILDAPAKKLRVTVENSGYRRM
jgi:hypothetical protein